MTDITTYYNSTFRKIELNECKHVVLWSGGVDSTLLLDTLLKKYGRDTKIGAFALEADFIDENKLIGEDKMRKAYTNLIMKRNYDLTFVCSKLDNRHPVDHPKTGAVQFAYWVTIVYPLLGDGTTLYTGLLLDDEQVEFVRDIENLIDTLNRLYGKKVKIKFPLKVLHKDMVIHKAFKASIINKTWVCEIPIVENEEVYQCAGKNCNSCRNHLKPLIELYKRGDLTKEEINKHLSETGFVKPLEVLLGDKNIYKEVYNYRNIDLEDLV